MIKITRIIDLRLLPIRQVQEVQEVQEGQVVLDKWVEIQTILKIDRCRDQALVDQVDQEDQEDQVDRKEETFSFKSSVSV